MSAPGAPPAEPDGAESAGMRRRVARQARSGTERARQARERAVERISQLERERSGRPFIDALLLVRDVDDRIAGRELASAVAYRVFFLMLPLSLFVVGGLGISGELASTAPADAVKSSGLSSAVASSIASSTEQVSLTGHLALLFTGLFGIYFAAIAMAKTLSRVHAAAWSMSVPKVRRKARAAGEILGLLVLVFVTSGVAARVRSGVGVIGFVLSVAVAGLLYSAIAVALQWALPKGEDVPWWALIPGAAVMGVTISVVQAFTIGFLAYKISRSSELYGGVGVAFALLFWLYILGRIVVMAPIVNSVLWQRRLWRYASAVSPALVPPGQADDVKDNEDRQVGR